MPDKSVSVQIDNIIKQHGGWKADTLSRLRTIILAADSRIFEEVKWKTPSRPEGLPVWSYEGIVCFAEIWKDNVKLIFFKGAKLSDPTRLFNSRLKSKTLRAIELHEGDTIAKSSLSTLVQQAADLNETK